jgi:antitoxin (DNA-binding transcriptional repressor) of toxin-antitoxin stability system
MAGEKSQAMEELRAQAQHQLAVRSSGLLGSVAQEIMNRLIEVGSYEAKTKLPELLRGIRAGNRYTITSRGEAVADLVPAEVNNNRADAVAAVDEMLAFVQTRKPVHGIRIKALIDEGRA